MRRAIVLILDGVGIGALPDAERYGDTGSNTLANLASACGGLKLPVLENLGLGNIASIDGVKRVPRPLASYGKMAEISPGKDSTTGHWELMGLVLDRPFPVYPDGFPTEIIKEFEARIGHRVIGNIPASGTEIIKTMGEEHIRSKRPIVYTSADSVFQIACHVDVFSLKELYGFCEIARNLLQGEHAVARVIARPFAGKQPDFYRTPDRRDFSLPPFGPTLLDLSKDQGCEVIAIGKVDNLFGNRGYTETHHSVNNLECMDHVYRAMDRTFKGLIIANFVQFDMDWGHRNNIKGFKDGLVEIDRPIGRSIEMVRKDDILMITADHGNDPTTVSTDHSREYVPLLFYIPGQDGRDLGVRSSFADVARTIARYLSIDGIKHGENFLW
jgi:phosphopentomutase